MPINKDNLIYMGIVDDYEFMQKKKYNVFFSKSLINAAMRNDYRNTLFVNTLFVPLSGPLEGQFYPVLRCNTLDGALTVKRTQKPVLQKIEDFIKPFYFAVVKGVASLTRDDMMFLLAEVDKLIAGTHEKFDVNQTEEVSDDTVSSTEPEPDDHSLQETGAVKQAAPVAAEPRDEDYSQPTRPDRLPERLKRDQVWAVFEHKRNPNSGEVEIVSTVARKITNITDSGVTYQQLGKFLGVVPKEATGTGAAEQRLLRHGPANVGYATFLRWIKTSGAELVRSRELVTQLENF